MTCTCKLCMAVPPEQRPVHKTETDLAPRLDERALESACMAFNNACPGEHWRRRDRMEAAIRAYLDAAPEPPALRAPPEGEVVVSASDPLTILAGIKQFGLAPDGADLRDLEAALERLSRRERELEAELHDWRNGDLRGVQAHMEAFRDRATTAEARAAELEAELAKFEPDLLPDDPKVARLTVHNSVWEWMRVGYRLHHAGRVGEQLAAVKTKLDTALEVLERLLEIVSPPTPGAAGEDSINERIRAAHDFLRTAKKGK